MVQRGKDEHGASAGGAGGGRGAGKDIHTGTLLRHHFPPLAALPGTCLIASIWFVLQHTSAEHLGEGLHVCARLRACVCVLFFHSRAAKGLRGKEHLGV